MLRLLRRAKMPQDIFLQRKKDILSKKDKSHIGKWDEKIVKLCEKINQFDNYYTTSSCSGRIIIISDQDEKAEDLFLKRYHDYLNFEELKKDLEEIAGKNKELIKIKLDPCALHVACESLEYANELINRAKLAGWKKSGIITANKRYIVELNSTERLEFPVINMGEILVNDKFLKILVKRANEKLNNTWEKIKILEESL
jgi:tRNA wybutosine-synthesizing protein 3